VAHNAVLFQHHHWIVSLKIIVYQPVADDTDGKMLFLFCGLHQKYFTGHKNKVTVSVVLNFFVSHFKPLFSFDHSVI